MLKNTVPTHLHPLLTNLMTNNNFFKWQQQTK